MLGCAARRRAVVVSKGSAIISPIRSAFDLVLTGRLPPGSVGRQRQRDRVEPLEHRDCLAPGTNAPASNAAAARVDCPSRHPLVDHRRLELHLRGLLRAHALGFSLSGSMKGKIHDDARQALHVPVELPRLQLPLFSMATRAMAIAWPSCGE